MNFNYTCFSEHEVAYKWHVAAPEDLKDHEVERLLEALIDWTDEPSTRQLYDMLNDDGYCESFDLNMESLIDLYMKVTVNVKSVHRDTTIDQIKKEN